MEMELNMLREALWKIRGPQSQLEQNLINPESGERWLRELKKFLRKEPCWTKEWNKKDGVIYFTLPPVDEMESINWISRLRGEGIVGMSPGSLAEEILSLPDPTSKQEATKVAVLTVEFFRGRDATVESIYNEAILHGFIKPARTVACRIREHFTNKEIREMDLFDIIVMHEPFIDTIEGVDFSTFLCVGVVLEHYLSSVGIDKVSDPLKGYLGEHCGVAFEIA